MRQKGIIFLPLLCGVMALVGCSVVGKNASSSLVATGTVIGFKVGVNTLKNTPEVCLAYDRFEGAIVPTSINPTTGKIDSASVLARLAFRSMFASNAGINSLICTGVAAEEQGAIKEDTATQTIVNTISTPVK